MFETYVGCYEWQEAREFDTLQEAQEYMESWRVDAFTMGLYTATEAWIRNDTTDYYEDIEI